jgi:hypothetical protein
MKNLPNWALHMLLVFALALAVAIGAVGMAATKPALQSGAVEVRNVFVDVNSDGWPDLIVAGDIIFNVPFLGIPTPAAAK